MIVDYNFVSVSNDIKPDRLQLSVGIFVRVKENLSGFAFGGLLKYKGCVATVIRVGESIDIKFDDGTIYTMKYDEVELYKPRKLHYATIPLSLYRTGPIVDTYPENSIKEDDLEFKTEKKFTF